MSNEIDLSEIRHDYENLEKIFDGHINEATIKFNIVVEVLKKMGYNSKFFLYEDRQVCSKSVDIAVLDPVTKNTLLHVEVKKQNFKFNNRSYAQLSSYLNSKNINWGILTNGNEYVLINNKVDGLPHQRCILKYLLFNKSPNHLNQIKNANILKFFTYEYLIKKDLTNYFIYLASFRNKTGNLGTFKQYESTMYNYFDFLCDKFNSFDLSNIKPETLEEFLIKLIKTPDTHNNKKADHQETIINKYTHVNNFYAKVIENSEKRNPFKFLNQKTFLSKILSIIDLNGFNLKEKEVLNNHELLTSAEIKMIIDYTSPSKNTLRNKLIVLLFVYCAIDRSEIIELKLKNLNLKKKQIKINNRILPLPNVICQLLSQYITIRQENCIDFPYLLYIYRNKTFKKVDESSINNILNTYISKLSIDEDRKKILNSLFFKRSLIINMYKSNIHIEEICKFTALKLHSINEYISEEDINKTVDLVGITSKHPYKDLFD